MARVPRRPDRTPAAPGRVAVCVCVSTPASLRQYPVSTPACERQYPEGKRQYPEGERQYPGGERQYPVSTPVCGPRRQYPVSTPASGVGSPESGRPWFRCPPCPRGGHPDDPGARNRLGDGLGCAGTATVTSPTEMRLDRDRYEPDREATGPRLWRDRLRRGRPTAARSLTRVRRDSALARRSGRAGAATIA